MIASSLTRFAARKGWPKDESFLIHGEWSGCPVTLVDGEGFIELVFSLPGFAESGSAWNSLKATIDEYSGIKIVGRFVIDGFLAIRIRRHPLSLAPSADSLDLFMTIIMDQAADLGLIAPHVCAICHQPVEERSTLFDLTCYVHPDCRTNAGDTLPSYPPYLRYEEFGKDPYRSLKTK